MKCRHCDSLLTHNFLDLGFAPPSNAYLAEQGLRAPETWFPLKLYVCEHCWLVQTEDYARADELFCYDYAYFSSTSITWLDHARRYVEVMRERLSLDSNSFVIEVASNDGYLLKNFVAAGIPCLGIEPTTSTAAAAQALGIPVLQEFFGAALGLRLAMEGRQADLILGNNVYAHVPDINDFTAGLKAALKPGGTITLEFPHLLRLIQEVQFDTVYHEHFSYLSLHTVRRIFQCAGLRIWHVEQLTTHGGSLRVFGCHENDSRKETPAVGEVIQSEEDAKLHSLETYRRFQARAEIIKNDLLVFLIEQKRARKKVVAYGAAAKGNTLMNYSGIRPDLIPFVVDRNLAKQGKYMPGSHVPIVDEPRLQLEKPDYVVILPWNLQAEVMQQLEYIRAWGGCFVTAVPELRIFPI